MTTILFCVLSLAIGLFAGMAMTLRSEKQWGLPNDLPGCRQLENLMFLFLDKGRGKDDLIRQKHAGIVTVTPSEEINLTEPERSVMFSMLVSDPSGLDHSNDAVGFHALVPKPISTTEYNRTLDLGSSLHLDIAANPVPNDGDRSAWAEKLTSLHDHIYTQIIESKPQGHESEMKD